jgi:hypothetical protein
MVYKLDYDTMLLIAEHAEVPKKVVEDMYIGYIVDRSDVVAVLKAFSETVGAAWTIENVNIEVRVLETSPKTTFLDLMVIFQVPLKPLAILAGVPEEIIDAMICSVPVRREDALKVLKKLSNLIYQDCTLEKVCVPVIENEEEGNEDANTEQPK